MSDMVPQRASDVSRTAARRGKEMPPKARDAAGDDAASRALAWIEEYCARTHAAVGSAMPNEQELARLAGVGRSSVREALTAMKALGMIHSRRKSGIRILPDPVLLELRHYFASDLKSQQRAADAMEFRAVLEWGLGLLIIANAGPRTVRALRRIIDKIISDGPGRADVIEAEVAFHRELTASANNRLASLLAHLYGPAFRQLHRRTPLAETQHEIDWWVSRHVTLIDALEKKDEPAFLSALADHMHSYMRRGKLSAASPRAAKPGRKSPRRSTISSETIQPKD